MNKQIQKSRVEIAVRVKGARKAAQPFRGIDAAVRALEIPASGTSILKRIRMAVQEAEVVEAEFGGVTYLFSQVVH